MSNVSSQREGFARIDEVNLENTPMGQKKSVVVVENECETEADNDA